MRRVIVCALFSAFAVSLACDGPEEPLANSQQSNANTTNANLALAEELPFDETDPLIKDNFDLQRAGEYLRRSDDPAEFEAYLNEPNGINNLDLNGDGYVDYISVEEFEDRDDGQRGLSLLARYGPDLVQNIADIFLYRDEPRYPGARVLIRGDDVLYGDDYYYEANWLDTTLGIANLLFGDHDRYRSPYYYDRYPPSYVTYDVVPTPIYRTRIVELVPDPIFVYAAAPPVYYERIKIKSPNNGLHLGQIYARPMKPTRAQIDFRRNNPGKPLHARKGDSKGKAGDPPGQRSLPPGQAKKNDNDRSRGKGQANPGRPDKPDSTGKPDRPGDRGKGGPPDKGKNRGKGKP